MKEKMKKFKMRFSFPLTYNEKIIELSNDRVYRDAILFEAGIWTDGFTNEEAEISRDVLAKYWNNWTSNFIDIDHRDSEVLYRIGKVKPKYFKGNKVYGDLRIMPITQNAKDTIALIDANLVNSLSSEVTTISDWDYHNNRWKVVSLEFTGIAVVVNGAIPSAKIK